MGTPTLTVMPRPERVVAFVLWCLLRVVAFVCGAFCVHGVHVCMALRSPCMVPDAYKVAPNIGKRNCNFPEEVCKFVLVFFPMLHFS